MSKNVRWTDELKKEMFSYFETERASNGGTIEEIAEKFSKLYGNMSATQVRNAYYHFRKIEKMGKKLSSNKTKGTKNTKSTKNTTIVKRNKRGNWTEKENDVLLQMAKNRKDKNLTDIFENYAKTHSRPVDGVRLHYYSLINSGDNKRENNKVNMSSLMKNIKNMPTDVAMHFARMAESISATMNK